MRKALTIAREDLAPSGSLRVSINLGNPILAGRKPDGTLFGVSVDLATELGRQLGVAVVLRPYDAAGKAVDALRSGEVDLGFFAIDPARSQGISFTAPYVLIEGAYLVRQDSPLTHWDQVDKAGHELVVGAGSAYDLFLTRHLEHARIVRAPTSPTVVDVFMQGSFAAAAGVKQQLEADRSRYPATRLLPESFMVIQQAMGAPERISSSSRTVLAGFIEAMKASGEVARSLSSYGIEGAAVAPPSSVAA